MVLCLVLGLVALVHEAVKLAEVAVVLLLRVLPVAGPLNYYANAGADYHLQEQEEEQEEEEVENLTRGREWYDAQDFHVALANAAAMPVALQPKTRAEVQQQGQPHLRRLPLKAPQL